MIKTAGIYKYEVLTFEEKLRNDIKKTLLRIRKTTIYCYSYPSIKQIINFTVPLLHLRQATS